MPSSIKETDKKPHCIHVIGIGRTGAAYVEALLRTGEIEDNLAADGTTFAALLIDIGDKDIQIPTDYARSFKSRLASRNIPVEKFHYEAVVLDVPDAATFTKELGAVRAPFKAAGGLDLIADLPKGYQMPKAGEHIPRAIAKAIAAFACHLDDKPLAGALQRFADHVKRANEASTVFVAFGLAGGTGSGIAFDLAATLKGAGLGDATQIVGVGQLSHSGDGDYLNSPAQTMALEKIDSFPGGCFIVSPEHSWQRLSSYTSTGLKEVRQNFKQMVTNRFVADSFMRWAVRDGSSHLLRALGHAGGKCISFNVAKLGHPGVQVLPGEARSKWDAVLQQWIGMIPTFSGLNDRFGTDYIEVHAYTARNMRGDLVASELKNLLVSTYAKKKDAAHYTSYSSEFFDELTAYADIILPGVTKNDLTAYQLAKTQAGQTNADVKVLEQA